MFQGSEKCALNCSAICTLVLCIPYSPLALFAILNVRKFSNSLTQHRRTPNLNVPLPQLNILLPPSFLSHLINRVPCVYININKYCKTLRL